MTTVVYFSGVHGSGKTTIRGKVTQRLQKAGMSVYAFPEFSYIPDIPIGTPEFQLWYRTQLRIRQELIQYLVDTKYFDIVIVDRHPVDEKVYAKRLGGDPHIEYFLSHNEVHIYVNRSIPAIVQSLNNRLEEEGQEHRKDWNEIDEEYLKYINDEFVKLYKKNANPVKKDADYANLGQVHMLTNEDLERAVTGALEIILRCIK